MYFHVGGSRFFRRASDFADQDDRLCFGILIQQLERVHVGGADNWIAADADRRRLPNPSLGELIDGLVGKSSGAGDDAHTALLVDAARHNADLGFTRRDNARTVGADQPRFRFADHTPHLDHVVGGDPLSDANDERKARIFGFEDGVGGKRRRDKNDGSVGACLIDCLGYGVEHRPAFMHRASLARRHSTYHFGPILGAAFGMEGPFLARDALHDEPRIFVH